MILLDTNVLVWLYAGDLRRIPRAVQRRLEREDLAFSPFAKLELGFLFETNRIGAPASVMVDDLSARLGLRVADVGIAAVCDAALAFSWTRDPFDRLLAAHATVSGLPLVTSDAMLRQNLPLAWWAD